MTRPLLIFLHGLACGAGDWIDVERVCSPWADSVAIALPGHDGTPLSGEPSIGQLAEATNGVRRNRPGQPHILVGHSMGCRVALEASRRHPAGVAGLVLIDSSLQGIGAPDDAVHARQAMPIAQRQARMHKLFAGFFGAATPAAFAASTMQRLAAFDPRLLASFEEAIVRWDAGKAEQAVASAVMPLLVIQATIADEQLNRRSIGAGEDTAWTAMVKRVARPDASVINLADNGHFPQVDDPSGLSALLRAFAVRLGVAEDAEAGRQTLATTS